MVARDVKEDAHAREADDEARAAVGHERQGDPGQRRDPHDRGDVDQRLATDERRDPGGEPLSERILAAEREPEARVTEGSVGPDQRRRPDEAELLADDREDHVRVRFREVEVLRDPLSEPHPEDPA